MVLISVSFGTPSCLVSWTLSRLHSWKLITPVNFLAPILLCRPLPGSHLPPVHLLIFLLLRLIPSVAWPLRCLTYAAPDVSLFGVFMGSSTRISCDSTMYLSPHQSWSRFAFGLLDFHPWSSLCACLCQVRVLGKSLGFAFPAVFLLDARMGGVWSVRSPRA
jgi:hypothetical protein